jgi:hypothetical protein
MKNFSDFAKETILDGDKISIIDVINEEVEIIGHTIKNSKFESEKYLTLQIKRNDKKYVIFTGSNVLIDQIEKYKDEIPFVTTIRKINKYYSLT